MLKKLVLILSSFLCAINIFAQDLSPKDEGSAISFSIKNFGITVNGSFKGLKGTVKFNEANPSTALFNLSVDAATVNTGINARDNHLKKEDYFDVAKFPLITFTSTKISATAKQSNFNATGNITIKGVTKTISFPFTATAKSNGYIFSGSFLLNRRDFNVGSSSLILSDNLNVSFSVYVTN